MPQIVIDVDDVTWRCLEHAAADPAAWAVNAVFERARAAGEDLLVQEVTRLVETGQPIPHYRADILRGARIPKAAERSAAAKAQAARERAADTPTT